MKRFFPFVAVALGFFLLSFNPRPVPRSLSRQKKIGNTVNPLNPTLYPLFIENTSENPRLDILIQLVQKQFFTNHFKKIVFQFVYQNNGFTLGIYIGRRNQTHFDDTLNFKLSTYNTLCVKNYPTIGPDVYLGDSEFDGQKNVIDTLKTVAIDKRNNRFIVFYPKLETVTENSFTKTTVKYKIYLLKDTSDICGSDLMSSMLQGTATGLSTNPSPPRNGN